MSRFLALTSIVGLLVVPTLSQPNGWYEPCPPATLSASLRHVVSLNATTAIAVGQDGIYRSANAGLTWERVYFQSSSWYYDAQFFDSNNGIAVGPRVVSTTDGGQTWNQVAQNSSTMLGSYFLSPTEGWAVNGKDILHTTDAGATWVSQFHETNFAKFLEDVVFLNSNTGIVVGGPSYGWRTTDGGQTWNPLDFGTTVWAKKVAFVSPTIGYAVGTSAAYISISQDLWGTISIQVTGAQPTVWKTTDAGATWNRQVFTNLSGWLRGVLPVNTQTTWVVGDNGILGRTTDGGTTWQGLDLGITQGLFGISFNGQNGVLGGNNATVLVTADNGSTWATPRNTRTTNTVDSLYFFDETFGIASAGTSLIRTTDGGESWQLLSQTVSNPPSIFFWNRDVGWLADGRVARTTDGGLTWKTDWSVNARGIQFPTATIGWAVGWNGLIAKTTQAAAPGSWVTQTSGTTNRLNSVWFVDEQNGWAVGDQGTILKTTDGGEHWEPKGPTAYPDTAPEFTRVRFLDQYTGWVTSYNRVLRTSDGGETWQWVQSLEAPSFVDERTGWAIPFFVDRISRTDDGGITWRTDADFESVGVYPQCVQFVNNRVGWMGAGGGRIFKTVSGGAGYKLFFPWLRSGGPDYTGFAIANPNETEADVSLQAFVPQGQPMYENPASIMLAPNQQIARVGTELFSVEAGTPQQGWIELTSDSYVGGLFQFGAPSRLDGAPPVSGSPVGALFFTRVYQGPTAFRGRPAQTLITIVNPGPEAIQCNLHLYTGDQSFYDAEAQRSIPPRGQLTESIAELFGKDASGGFVEAWGDGLIGFAKIDLTADATAIGLNAAGPDYSKFRYAGQLAEIPGVLFTSVKLVNVTYGDRLVKLTAIGDQGQVLAGPVERTIPGRQAIEMDAQQLFGFTSAVIGTMKVEVDALGGVVGDVIFGDSAGLTYAAGLALQAQPFREALFNHVAEGLGFFTGLAVHVPGSKAADVTISVYAPSGTLTGTTTFSMAAGTRLSRLISEYVTAAQSQVGGYVRVTSTEPLIAQVLFGYPQLLSAVPPTVLR